MQQTYSTLSEKVIDIVREQKMVRPRDLVAQGIPQMYLQRLYESGKLERLGRGIYVLAEADFSTHLSFVEVCKRVPLGTICLLSALQFHNLGTQNPHQVWLALPNKAHTPRLDFPPLHVVRFSGPALSEGIEEHQTSEGAVRVYGVAKTVVDCFRFRNKIGLDVALEALRECRRDRRATLDEIWRFAVPGRVSTVMRPYLEAIT